MAILGTPEGCGNRQALNGGPKKPDESSSLTNYYRFVNTVSQLSQTYKVEVIDTIAGFRSHQNSIGSENTGLDTIEYTQYLSNYSLSSTYDTDEIEKIVQVYQSNNAIVIVIISKDENYTTVMNQIALAMGRCYITPVRYNFLAPNN